MKSGKSIWVYTGEAAKIIGVSRDQVGIMIRAGCFATARRQTDRPASRYIIDLKEVKRAKDIYRGIRAKGHIRGMKPLYMRDKGC